ncbi:hypothetical protein PPYR_12908 [Photinus pyralis]|uniref:Protein CIP2A n=3 Tax=Photinus pyralis TaxID=7054 RepID=A0A5N4A7R1_PHOPY|nr:uncharacterized protein LOC116177770 [Photinus pyralis]KAB0793288.1 hypothetical protein PPYR_12908 [Photinus pyralis]
MEPNAIDKHYNMKEFINVQKDYAQTKAEDSANLMVRHLQLLSVTIDLSTFDPHVSVVAEFFVSLHRLLSAVEPGSLLAWCSVNVLCVACKNAAARTALIHTYQFLPLLSRLLGNQLTMEKKLRLLTLMQELTCGIKISWQIPHLPHLMSTLTRWITGGDDDDIATLSLAVLVNLCYKNLPAVYTLSRCVDIKKFLRTCLLLQGVRIEVHVCKLSIILDYMSGTIPEGVILKLVEVTFRSLTEAFKARDSILLRHIVEFFLDVWDQRRHGDVLNDFSTYDEEFEKILMELENTALKGKGDVLADNEPQCVSSVLEFIHFVIELREPKIEQLNARLVNIALKWLQVELVSSDALAILRTLAINVTVETCAVLNPFLTTLPLFLLHLVNVEGEILDEGNKRLTSLMELLGALMQIENTRAQVVGVLKEEIFFKIFSPLLETTTPRIRDSNANAYSLKATILYIKAIALIYELKKYEETWKVFFSDLMQHKQIHMVLAQALCFGNKPTKLLTMRLMADDYFPKEAVSEIMCDIQPVMDDGPNEKSNSTRHMMENLCFPAMSVTQIKRLDEIIDIIKEAYEKNDLANISISDVMELYEYKLATLSHAERAAIASVEAASFRCTHLQHKSAQLTTELSKVHQLLLRAQQRHEESSKTISTTLAQNTELQDLLGREKINFSNILSQKEKIIDDQAHQIDSTNSRLKDVENEKLILNQHHTALQEKLRQKITKYRQLLESKEKELSKREGTINAQQTQILQLDTLVKRGEVKLDKKRREFDEVLAELQNCKSILGTITQLTSPHYACKDEE